MEKLAITLVFAALALLAAACTSTNVGNSGKVIKSAPVGNNLTVTLSSADGVLRNGENEFSVSFKDGSGKPVDVGAVGLNFYMPAMGTMPEMNNAASFVSTGNPGVYEGKAKLESAGDWQAQISYEGAAGKGKSSFTVTAR
ncbi:MAG TPA: FixH family protein [Pyrinomonadaceae bacterium]|nr:FixH family protein [Pyrinomonadaceae bacterium]